MFGSLLGRYDRQWLDSLIPSRNFLPGDTVLHSWEVLAKILGSEEAEGVVCDIGMCVHSSLSLSRRVPLTNSQAGDPQKRELQLQSDHSQ